MYLVLCRKKGDLAITMIISKKIIKAYQKYEKALQTRAKYNKAIANSIIAVKVSRAFQGLKKAIEQEELPFEETLTELEKGENNERKSITAKDLLQTEEQLKRNF